MPLLQPIQQGEALLADIETARQQAMLDGKPQLHIWWLGQSGFLVHYQDKFLLLDPYLSDSLTIKYAQTDKPHTRISELVIDPARLPELDVITSSHNHTDHLDAETLIPILRNSPRARLIFPEANRHFVANRLGLPEHSPTLVGLVDGQAIDLAGFRFYGVPAAHNEIERNEKEQPVFMGFVIKVGDYTLYHSGDTLWYDGMVETLKPFAIDVAFLPINGNKPERRVAGNLNPDEAARLGAAIGAKLVIPHHYDLFAFNTADPADFEQACAQHQTPCRVMQLGERLSWWSLLILFLFFFQPVWAQSPEVGGGSFSDSVGRQSAPCIGPAQRAEIKQRLQDSRQALGIQPSDQKLPHPLLIHPLQKAAHCRDFYPSSVWQFLDHNQGIGAGSFNANGPSNQDYSCGSRTYDNANGYNHSGTDFGLWPFGWSKMDQNMVEVIAAAPGIILVKDDGNPDRSCNGAVQSTNWNAVYIQHADGSVAWYGHLKRNSLTFKPVGSLVEAGEYLGTVGSSGFSTAPHLHFELYSADNQLVDPYGGTCNSLNGTDSWWQQQEPYLKKQINAITLHRSLLAINNSCPAENAENPNELNTVAADGSLFYVYVWGRNLELNELITTALFRPNGSQYSSVSYISNFGAPTFYTYYSQTIPSTESLGPWQARITYGGQTYTKIFFVTGPGADLSLTMRTSALTVPLNATVGYELSLKNEGTLTANNVMTRAYLPANLTFLDSPDASMSHSAGVVSGNTITLSAGNARTLRFRARPTLPGTFLTTAQITQSSTQDPDSQPNSGTRDGQDDMSSAQIQTTAGNSVLFSAYAPEGTSPAIVEGNQPPVDPRRADLSLSLLTNKRVARLNEIIDISLIIRHQGGTKAENVVAQCRLPTGLSYVSGLSALGNVLTGTIPALYAGQEVRLTFQVLVTTPGRWPLAAQLTACNQPDPDSQPNNGLTNGEDDTATAELVGQ